MLSILITLALSLFTYSLLAQEIGKPFIQNYSKSVYKAQPQNWAVLQDDRGIVFVGNNDGLLEYDGINWQKLSIGTVRSLAKDQNGRVFVGGEGKFGYLAPDSLGKLKYYSLSQSLSETEKNYIFWKTYATPKGIIFQANEAIFLWTGKKLRRWLPNPDKKKHFHFSFFVDGQFYVKEQGAGILQLKGESLELLPNTESLADEKIYTILNFDSAHLLIGTRHKGLFLYHKQNQNLQNFTTKADQYLLENQLYDALIVQDIRPNAPHLVLATLRGGILMLDRNGEIQQIINKNSGLQSNVVLCLTTDQQGGIWAGLENGISRLELLSPLTHWENSGGLEGSVQEVYRFKGKLYVASSLGVYILDNYRFKQISGISSACWNFLEVNERLLVASDEGVFEIQGTKAQLIAQYDAYCLEKSTKKEVVYVGLEETGGVAVLSYENDSWQDLGTLNNFYEIVRDMAEDQEGNLWTATNNGTIHKIRFGKNKTNPLGFKEYFFAQNPLGSDVLLYKYPKGIRFATPNGIFVYEQKTDKLIADQSFPATFTNGKIGVYRIAQENANKFWLSVYNFNKNWIEILRKKDQSFERDSVALKRLPPIATPYLYPENEGITWIGSEEGLFRFDDNIHLNYEQKFRTLIRKVQIGDSVLFYGNFWKESPQGKFLSAEQATNSPYSLAYHYNSIAFQFSASSYDSESANQYSYFLENYERTWSAWSKESRKEYTNLPEGTYTFRVRSRNIYGYQGQESRFHFRIEAPWYKTSFAYAFYFLLLGLLIYLGTLFYTRHLRRRNEILEKTIKERTSEITKKNEQLQEQTEKIMAQRDMLEQKNTEIVLQKDKTDQAYRNIQLLSQIGQQITATLSLDNIKKILYENLVILADVAIFGIGIYNEQKACIEFENYIENGTICQKSTFSIADESSLSAVCLYHRQEILIADYFEEYKKFTPHAPMPKRNELIKSIIYLPLISQNRSLGVFTIQSYKKEAYGSNELNILKNLAVYVAIAIENADSYEKINEQKRIIEDINHKISRSNQNMLDSINYASRIQNAILPKKAPIEMAFDKNIFILLKPKDVVSGDFYWFFEKIMPDGSHKIVITAVDCTGHGVPGAFMSLIGHDLLNEIVVQKKIFNAEQILQELNYGVIKALRQDETQNRDGMDMALCVIDKQKQELQYAGANNPLYYVKNDEFFELKADKSPIGFVSEHSVSKSFTRNTLPIDQDIYVYLLSDGFQDQFGGEKGKKFMKARLKKLFLEVYLKDFQRQAQIFEQVFEDWKSYTDPQTGKAFKQTDDMLVIGFKLSPSQS